MRLTKEQQTALKRVWDRVPLNALHQTAREGERPISYLAFRHKVRPCFGDKCVVVPWCGMWLGIEPDGYTHS